MPADAGHRLGVSFSEDLGTRIVGWLIDRRRRGHLTARHERACAAAAEAAEDDPAFAVDAIMGRTRFIAERLAAAVAAADVDEAALREICTARLAERLAGRMLRRGSFGLFQAVPDGIELFLVGVENLQDDALDRVVVAVLGGPPTEAGTVQLAEVWSLARGEDEWLLADVEAHRAGRRHLDAPLVASPWDASEVADRATLELAAGTPAAREPDELLARDAEGLSALRDLALVDSRWAPDVLAAAVRRLLRCWEHTAVEGDNAFEGVASTQAAAALVHPRGAASRLDVRGLELERLDVAELLLADEPPAVRLVFRVRGRRALYDVGAEVPRLGSLARDRSFEERWLLQRTDDPDRPWRLAHVDPVGWQRRDKREAARQRYLAGER